MRKLFGLPFLGNEIQYVYSLSEEDASMLGELISGRERLNGTLIELLSHMGVDASEAMWCELDGNELLLIEEA